jgi:hypothetical protein
MADKTKIYSTDCWVYIAKRTAPGTEVSHATFPGTDWKDVGYFKGGTAKLSTDKHEIDLNDGGKQLLGKTLKFECAALQTDEAQRTLLEAFEGEVCDIILKPVRASITRITKLLAFSISVGLEGVLSSKDTLALPLSGEATGPKLSDLVDDITLS